MTGLCPFCMPRVLIDGCGVLQKQTFLMLARVGGGEEKVGGGCHFLQSYRHLHLGVPYYSMG